MLLILSADQKVSGEHLCDYVGHILSGIVTVETAQRRVTARLGILSIILSLLGRPT